MKVFITRQIPDQGIKMLREKGYELKIREANSPISKKELISELKNGYDALLSLLTDKIDGDVMDAGLPRLKIIANYAVGFDNVNIEEGKKRNLLMTNTPGPEITESVAEHTFALMIALARRLVESDKFLRAGNYKGWQPMLLLGTDLHHKTLGIVGLGRIGFAVAERAVKGFKMKLVYHDVKPNPDFESQFGGVYKSLDDLLKESDFVSLHVPLLPSTTHLISDAQLAMMKPTAFLINTARGPIVDEFALSKALRDKKIGGAGLDVFECEPSIDCIPDDHLDLKSFDNVVLTPHTASASIEARQAMSRVAAQNIIEALEGRTPPNLVK
ncbi:MAG: D-glycerate dehydrogenase [bacterium]|nr:D-glycerate dehydrogenase [bacterium]